MALKGVPKTPEHRAKIAAANLGKRASADTRAKMSAARKGRVVSPETRAKMSAARMGIVYSDETRARMSAAKKGKPAARPFTADDHAKSLATRRGRPLTPEHRAKLAAAKIGKPGPWAGKARGPYSAEHRAKIGQAQIGRRHSDATRKKIGAALYGHTPAHGKRVPYKGLVFRSQMEVDVATALDALSVPWEYEKYRIDFGDFTYAPDFFLPDDGCFWEVKGWYGPDSQRKVNRFRRDLPEVPIVVMSKQSVHALMRSARTKEQANGCRRLDR